MWNWLNTVENRKENEKKKDFCMLKKIEVIWDVILSQASNNLKASFLAILSVLYPIHSKKCYKKSH